LKERLKKSLLIPCIVVFLLLSPPLSESGVKFGIKLFGGGNYLLGGDLNKGLKGAIDYWNDDLEVTITGGRFRPIEYGFEYGAEIILDITTHLGIGIGGWYMQTERSTRLESMWFGSENYVDYYKPRIRAIPASCSLHFRLPVASFLKITANLGADYYWVTINWKISWERTDDQSSYEENWKSKSEAIGYHGSLGLEFGLGHGIGIVIEGIGRLAILKDLKGDLHRVWRSHDSEREDTINNATFWYTEYKSFTTDKSFPMIVIDSEEPSGPAYSSVRKGKVDLSGASLRIGLKITF